MKLHLYINALGLSVVLSACAQNLPDSVTAASKTSSSSTSAAATGNVSVVDPGAGSSTSGTASVGTSSNLPVILDSTGSMVVSGQSYFLRNVGSANCLDVTGAATDDGTAIQPYDCNAGFTNQMWTATLSTTGTVTFTSVDSGKCLDIDLNNITSNDAYISIWECSGVANQSFVLTASNGGYRISPSDALGQAIQEISGQILSEGNDGLTDQAYKLVPSSSANPAN